MSIVRGASVGAATGVVCALVGVLALGGLTLIVEGPSDELFGWGLLFALIAVVSAAFAGLLAGGVGGFVAGYVHATQPFDRARLAGAGTSAGLVVIAGLMGTPSLGFALSLLPLLVVAAVAFAAMSRSMEFILDDSPEPPAYGVIRAPRPAWQRWALVGLAAAVGFAFAASVTGQALVAASLDRQVVDLGALAGALLGGLAAGALAVRATR